MDKKYKFSKENALHLAKVGGFMAASAAGTAIVNFVTQIDFGESNVIVFAGMNFLIVAVKELLRRDR